MADFKIVVDMAKLENMIATNPSKLADVITKTATRILSEARMITPRDPARPPENPDAYKPSGHLRSNSNVVKVDAQGLTQRVEYYEEYAAAQELGVPVGYSEVRPWMFIPARPFLTPTTEKNVDQFQKDIGKVIEE